MLYVTNLWLRTSGSSGAVSRLWLTGIAILLLGVSAWIDSKSMYVDGLAVEPQAKATARTALRSLPRRAA